MVATNIYNICQSLIIKDWHRSQALCLCSSRALLIPLQKSLELQLERIKMMSGEVRKGFSLVRVSFVNDAKVLAIIFGTGPLEVVV